MKKVKSEDLAKGSGAESCGQRRNKKMQEVEMSVFEIPMSKKAHFHAK